MREQAKTLASRLLVSWLPQRSGSPHSEPPVRRKSCTTTPTPWAPLLRWPTRPNRHRAPRVRALRPPASARDASRRPRFHGPCQRCGDRVGVHAAALLRSDDPAVPVSGSGDGVQRSGRAVPSVSVCQQQPLSVHRSRWTKCLDEIDQVRYQRRRCRTDALCMTGPSLGRMWDGVKDRLLLSFLTRIHPNSESRSQG